VQSCPSSKTSSTASESADLGVAYTTRKTIY
jgi:hypothetical protein